MVPIRESEVESAGGDIPVPRPIRVPGVTTVLVVIPNRGVVTAWLLAFDADEPIRSSGGGADPGRAAALVVAAEIDVEAAFASTRYAPSLADGAAVDPDFEGVGVPAFDAGTERHPDFTAGATESIFEVLTDPVLHGADNTSDALGAHTFGEGGVAVK